MNTSAPDASFPFGATPKTTFTPPPRGLHIHSLESPPVIKDIWEDNFDEEFRKIMKLAEQYRFIAMDTEFPGIVYRLNDTELHYNDSLEYKVIKKNVDQLKCIQVGFSLCNEEGHMPPGVSTWQFNLKFDKSTDECSQDSIDLLVTSGVQFEKHASNGVSPQLFGEYLISSGLLLNEDVTWVCYHGGFDFAYLLKMLVLGSLPNDDVGFYKSLNTYFLSYYDVKYMVRDIDSIKMGGLSKLASDLNIKRFGPQHQAGSDALLTLAAFMKLREVYFKNSIEPRYGNVLYGIGNSSEALADYLPNYINYADYGPMMYNGFSMSGVSPNMISSFYNQPDVYPNMSGSNYNFSYNMMYNNYPQNQFMDTTTANRAKKFEGFSGSKSDVRK